MTTLRQAAETALEALEKTMFDGKVAEGSIQDKAIQALRQALAQPEQEREWVGLTDEDLKEARKACHGGGPSYRFAYWVESICKEKNT